MSDFQTSLESGETSVKRVRAGLSVAESLAKREAEKREPSPPPIVGKASGEARNMNDTEAAYAELLECRRRAGEIVGYWFEGVQLFLGSKCNYRPDFLVQLASGELEFHEVKGFWRDDARVKIQVAARAYPFRFVAVKKRAKKSGGDWEIEEIKP